MAGVPEDFQRRIMRIRSWRRSLSVPTENRSAAIRREMPWARERTETGVQTSRATGQAAARIQTAQVRAQAGPGQRAGQRPSRAIGTRPRGPEKQPGNRSGRHRFRTGCRGRISFSRRLQHYFRLGGAERAGKGEHRRSQIPAHGYSVQLPGI